VAWNRLQAIDIHASVERTKATLPTAFPEATVEQDKTYGMDLDHPILTHARFSWEWGCSCLEMAAFDVKDFNTWTRVKDTFLPCVEHGLGPVSSSSPPFDYQWRARADIARVRLAPAGVYLYFERNTSDAAYHKVLSVLDNCRK
jgi:hypothetical protein